MSSLDSTLTLRACGKINLHLRVLARRPDGFHDLATWMQAVDWHDDLSIKPTPGKPFTFHCDDPRLTDSQDNLVIRAARALASRVDRPLEVAVHLTKRLPIGGGMGGGSSDAAAMLRALATFWNLPKDDPRLFEAAAMTGSDVPFFLDGPSAIATGRGTELRTAPAVTGWAVLVLPPFGTSTAMVYTACRPRAREATEIDPWSKPWGGASELSDRLSNDLFPAACIVEPRLAALHARVNNIGGVRVHLSGSGSTLFALFDTEDQAANWQTQIDGCGAITRCVRLLTK